MQGNCHDPSRTIETFDKSRWLYWYSHFHHLQTLNTFSQDHVRQDPGVNSKKKPDLDEEKKEEKEREEEEEEVAAALDNNDASRE